MVSRVIPVDPFDLVIFGGSGDLAKLCKILPGLFRRFVSGQMPPNAQIISAARSEFDQEQYRALIREAVCVFGNIAETHPELTAFINRLSYVQIDARGRADGQNYIIECAPTSFARFIFLLAQVFLGILRNDCARMGLPKDDSRIVVEKPFGHDLAECKSVEHDAGCTF